MSNFVYLISTTFLKDNTPINENVDDKLLKSAIKEAQEIYIRDVIGSGIYNELQTQAFAGTITNANTTLLDVYIAPCLKYYTLTESMLPMTFKMLNKTLGTRTSDNTQPVSIDEMTLIERRYRDKAEYYAQRLREFLQANSTIYPLYFNPGSTIDTIRPHNTQLFGGIYLPPDYDEEFRYYDFPKGESPNQKRN
jgi:hypothetical protein